MRPLGTSLLDLHGIGPFGAARLLIDIGDMTRFPSKGHFASWNETAPLDASSGEHVRHWLSRAGNRQSNRTLHSMATVQLRNPTEGRASYDRRKAAGKTSTEAMRCPERRLSDIVYRTMLNDAMRTVTGPGGHRGNVAEVQRGRLTSPHRLFGPVTSRTRHQRADDRASSRVLTQRGAGSGCRRLPPAPTSARFRAGRRA